MLLLVFVAVAPFPWGAVLLGGKLKIELFAFVICSMILASTVALRTLRSIAIPVCAMTAIAMLGGIQLIPLPSGLLSSLSPASAMVYRESNAILQLYGRPAIVPRVSIAPFETMSASLLVLSYAALLAGSFLILQSRRRRRVFLAIVLAAAALEAMWYAGTATARLLDRLRGPFVNPNHFAGYLEIALAAAFGLLWREVLYSRERGSGGESRAERFERRLLPIAGCILLWGVIAIGIGLTKSRGGIAAAAVSTLVMLFMAILHRQHRRRTRLAVFGSAMLLVALAFVALITREEPLLRYLESDPREIGADMRVALWKSSVDAWQLFPHLGSGLGTFREAYRHAQPRSIPDLVEQAHSDPLQLLVTAGWVGGALGLVALVAILVILSRAWKRQQRREESAFALAGIGALVSLTLHGLVEFNFSIPAIPATLACLLGWALAAGMGGNEEDEGT